MTLSLYELDSCFSQTLSAPASQEPVGIKYSEIMSLLCENYRIFLQLLVKKAPF